MIKPISPVRALEALQARARRARRFAQGPAPVAAALVLSEALQVRDSFQEQALRAFALARVEASRQGAL